MYNAVALPYLFWWNMIFRRFIAGFLVLVFVVTALFSFLVFALSNTFLNPEFYRTDFSRPGYEFLVDFTVNGLKENDTFIAQYFNESDLRAEIMTVFPETLFQKLLTQFSLDIEEWMKNPSTPLTLSFRMYRESLLTLAHNLSYRVFESLPQCQEAEVPEIGENNLPSCVPAGAEYNVVSAPFAGQFEKAVYAAVPEQIPGAGMSQDEDFSGWSLDETPLAMLLSLEVLKLSVYGFLLFLIAAIALLVFRPFASILMFEGTAFLLSGLAGLLVAFGFSFAKGPTFEGLSSSVLEDELYRFTGTLFGFVGGEIQKAAWIFLALGAATLLVKLYLRKSP